MRSKGFVIIVILIFMSSHVSASDCYKSYIKSPTPFMGNDGEIFQLSDGSVWEVKHEYEYLYEYYPNVIICPSRGKLGIKNKMLHIEQIRKGKPTPSKSDSKKSHAQEVIESNIDGTFNGWEGATIVKLMNGQIWQQTQYYYHYNYAYTPKVIVYRSSGGYKMKIDGIEESVGVALIKE